MLAETFLVSPRVQVPSSIFALTQGRFLFGASAEAAAQRLREVTEAVAAGARAGDELGGVEIDDEGVQS